MSLRNDPRVEVVDPRHRCAAARRECRGPTQGPKTLLAASGFPGEGLFFLPPLEHLGDRFFDGLSRVIQEEGAFRWPEGGYGAVGIACFAGLEVGEKTRECS